MDGCMINYLLDLVNINTSIGNNFGLLFQDKVILYLYFESGINKSYELCHSWITRTLLSVEVISLGAIYKIKESLTLCTVIDVS